MRRIVKQLMIAALFAVAMLGGGEVPILHAPQFAAAHAFAHQHMDNARGDVHLAAAAYLDLAAVDADHDHESPSQNAPGSDRGCTHAHAHCCAATAILAPEGTLSPQIAFALVRFERNAALPYGQPSLPLRRPPRLTA